MSLDKQLVTTPDSDGDRLSIETYTSSPKSILFVLDRNDRGGQATEVSVDDATAIRDFLTDWLCDLARSEST